MKKNLMLFLLFIMAGVANKTYSQFIDVSNLQDNPNFQNWLQQKRGELQQLQDSIQSVLPQLTRGVGNNHNVLEFENFAHVFNTANLLQDLDDIHEQRYVQIVQSTVQFVIDQQICGRGLNPNSDLVREPIIDYLEDGAMVVPENFASKAFGQALSFRSVLEEVHEEEENWLAAMGTELDNANPIFKPRIQNDLFWSVLNPDCNITVRNPEPEIANATGLSSGRLQDVIEVLTFIFDNWETISEILDWLNDNVFYDCHPSVSAKQRDDWRQVPSNISPDVDRRIYYVAGQKGVFGDLKATKTKIEGKAKLYKKKGRRYKKDRNNIVGIGYCTKQWNPCDNIPWPADGGFHSYAGSHAHKKAKFKHRHPYALTIYRSDHFNTFYLYYNFNFVAHIYLLGSPQSCE
jgi:hypothetical protein